MFRAIILRRNEYGQFILLASCLQTAPERRTMLSVHISLFLVSSQPFLWSQHTLCPSPTNFVHDQRLDYSSPFSKWVTVPFLTLPLLFAIEFVRIVAFLSRLLPYHFLLLCLRFPGSGSRKTSGRSNVTSLSLPGLRREFRRCA